MTTIVAEVGVNHDGYEEKAFQLIDAAAKAGGDVVKFQAFVAAHHGLPQGLELLSSDCVRLMNRCEDRGVDFLLSVFDIPSLELFIRFEPLTIKLPSGALVDEGLLHAAGKTECRIILSTGMGTLKDIDYAVGILDRYENDVILLHCTSAYPTPYCDVNLRAMDTLRDAFGLPVGLSDHTLGWEVAVAAVARGAVMIEKHITLDRTLPGPDHAASIEPDEFAAMVRAVRNVELALGDGLKVPQPSERPTMERLGR